MAQYSTPMRSHLDGVGKPKLCLPFNWDVKVASSYSPMHYCVMHTMWLDERTMGWSEWRTAETWEELVTWARGYVDECMASCLPDTGLPPVSTGISFLDRLHMLEREDT